jgi:hypothetical protein
MGGKHIALLPDSTAKNGHSEQGTQPHQLGQWDESHDLHCFPRGHDFVSSCRLGTGSCDIASLGTGEYKNYQKTAKRQEKVRLSFLSLGILLSVFPSGGRSQAYHARLIW